TLAALVGQEASSAVGSLANGGDVVGLSGTTETSLVGDLQPSTPGFATLVGQAATGAAGTLTPQSVQSLPPPVDLSGQVATISIGTLAATIQTYDRPHSLSGPFPFLTGGFFQFRQRAILVNPLSQSRTDGLIGVQASGIAGTIGVGSNVV